MLRLGSTLLRQRIGRPLSDYARNRLFMYVNGAPVETRGIDVKPEESLLLFLRNRLGLTGTKRVCDEGACGACTVLLSEWDDEKKEVNSRSVCSCLLPAGKPFIRTQIPLLSRSSSHI